MEFTTTVEVRFRDLDTMGHVNNSVYATYLEQARAKFFDEVLGTRLDRVETVLVTLTIDFRTPITDEDEVEVAVQVTDLGTSSIPMSYEISDGDRLFATAETVQVLVDSETGDPKALPEAWRTAMTQPNGGT